MSIKDEPMHVVIAGGGVAAVEAALALNDLARDLVRITMLAPEPTFTYRPELVGEPFAYPTARRYSLGAIAADLNCELLPDSLDWVDTQARVAHTSSSRAVNYDALLLAVGARATPAIKHAVTLVPAELDDQLQGVVQDLEGGFVRSIAFVIPDASSWPLPMYELALMTARRANDMNVEAAITLITPEDAPLAVFGKEASNALQAILDGHGIETITSSRCTTTESGHLWIFPADLEIVTDAIIALPALSGPAIPGIPVDAPHGFITTDRNGRVRGVYRVFAAGDLTDFPLKQGGIASQQADSAAASIAALAGADIAPEPITPSLWGVLWNSEGPLYLRARMTGSHGSESQVSTAPLWSPPDKIHARYLGPYLDALGTRATLPADVGSVPASSA